MKEFILDARNVPKAVITTAIESGVDFILIKEEQANEIKKLGRVKLIIQDKEGNLSDDFVIVKIENKADEEKAANLAKSGKKS
jgi:3-dehydroquinate synthase (EC 4.